MGLLSLVSSFVPSLYLPLVDLLYIRLSPFYFYLRYLRNTLYTKTLWYISTLLFPFKYPIKPLTLNFGGIEINMCTWSEQTSTSCMITFFHSHKLLRIAPTSSLFWWKNTFLLYFGAKTTWYLQFQVVCAKLRLVSFDIISPFMFTCCFAGYKLILT